MEESTMNDKVEEMLELFPNLDPDDIEYVLEQLAADENTSYEDFMNQLGADDAV